MTEKHKDIRGIDTMTGKTKIEEVHENIGNVLIQLYTIPNRSMFAAIKDKYKILCELSLLDFLPIT